MNTAKPTPPVTAGSVLLGDSSDADTTEVLARSFSEHGVTRSGIPGLRHLSDPALRAVAHQLAAVTKKSLDLDLEELLVAGWRKYSDLIDAAARTLAEPGSEEVVVLATHRIVSTHHQDIELLVDDATVRTFVFELSVAFDLNAVLAVVRQGELVALRGGECVVTVTLTLEDVSVMPPQEQRIDPVVMVTLDRPVPLLNEPEGRLEGSADRPAR